MTVNVTLNNGIQMPALGFGVFQTPPDITAQAVRTALTTGYRLIDTAAAYGNEREVGQAISHSGLARDDVFIETKIWISDYGSDQTLHAFDKSAGKLGVDQLPRYRDHHLRDLAINAIAAPRQDPGAGDDPLAPAGRALRDPEIGAARTDHRELRRVRLRAHHRRAQSPERTRHRACAAALSPTTSRSRPTAGPSPKPDITDIEWD